MYGRYGSICNYEVHHLTSCMFLCYAAAELAKSTTTDYCTRKGKSNFRLRALIDGYFLEALRHTMWRGNITCIITVIHHSPLLSATTPITKFSWLTCYIEIPSCRNSSKNSSNRIPHFYNTEYYFQCACQCHFSRRSFIS